MRSVQFQDATVIFHNDKAHDEFIKMFEASEKPVNELQLYKQIGQYEDLKFDEIEQNIEKYRKNRYAFNKAVRYLRNKYNTYSKLPSGILNE